mgnify:CR=1 FL=1
MGSVGLSMRANAAIKGSSRFLRPPDLAAAPVGEPQTPTPAQHRVRSPARATAVPCSGGGPDPHLRSETQDRRHVRSIG